MCNVRAFSLAVATASVLINGPNLAFSDTRTPGELTALCLQWESGWTLVEQYLWGE